MKYGSFFFIFFLFSYASQAQLAVIQDPDGFTNVREYQGAQSKILDQIKACEVFWVVASEDNQTAWRDVAFYRDYEELSESRQAKLKDKLYMNRLWMYGYIHQSRIRFIEDFPSLDSVRGTDSTAEYSNGAITVKFAVSSFHPKDHDISVNDNWVAEIDGKIPFGTDGEMPKARLSAVSVTQNHQTISIPEEMLEDLYLPGIKYWNAGVFTGPNEEIFIVMHNSDGAGYYDLVWVVKEGKVLSRYAGSPY
ncbi:MAG: hypothetical protein R3C61_22115 [Bacteroidia bacterium]